MNIILKESIRKIGRYLKIFLFNVFTFLLLIAIVVTFLQTYVITKYDVYVGKIKSEERAKIQKEMKKVSDEADMVLSDIIMHLQPKIDPDMAKRIMHAIELESKANNLEPSLVTAIIAVESEFNPFAESSAGAYGLMQIRHVAWKESDELINAGANSRGSLFWIDRNIKAGCKIFRKYYDESGCNLAKALYRYNTGGTSLPSNDRYGVRYVDKVIQNAYTIKTMIANSNACSTNEDLLGELKEIPVSVHKKQTTNNEVLTIKQ